MSTPAPSAASPAAPSRAPLVKAAPVAAANPTPIGFSASGAPVSGKFWEFTTAYVPYQPSVASLALTPTPDLADMTVDLAPLPPLPTGLSLIRSPEGRQLQLKVAPFFASKLRRVHGYVADILLTAGDGADAPAQLQVITKVPWEFGPSKAEVGSSWMLTRVHAFASKSLFSKPAQIVKLGSCVVGFTEPSSGNARSCQLVGWDICSIDDWRAASPGTVPSQWDLAFNREFFHPSLFPPPPRIWTAATWRHS